MEKRSPPSPDAAATRHAKRTKFCSGSCDTSEELSELRGLLLDSRGEVVILREENDNNKETIRNHEETIRKLQSELQAVAADHKEACVRAADNVHVANDLRTHLMNVTESRDKVRLYLMLRMMPHTVGLICDSSSKSFANTVPSSRQLLPNSTKPGGYPHPRTLLSSSISVS